MPARYVAPTRRVNRGRNHEYFVDGRKVDGVTTLIKTALAKPALVGWAARSVTEFVIEKRHLLPELRENEIWDLLSGAPWRERDAAANRGVEVHRLAAAMAHGAEVVIPPELVGHVDAYRQWWADWQPDDDALVERSIVNRQYRYAGTFDLVTRLHNAPELGLVLADIKTGKAAYSDTALQLVAYKHGETMLEQRGRNDWIELPMPKIDTCAVISVKHDSYEFFLYDVGEWEWRTFLYIAETARWLKARAYDDGAQPVMSAPLLPPHVQPELRVVKAG